MNKTMIIILTAFMSMSTFSRQVDAIKITCWEQGVTQTPDNIIYDFGSGYSQTLGYLLGGFIIYDGYEIDFEHPDAGILYQRSECTNVNVYNKCEETVVFDTGTVTLELEKTHTFSNGTQGMKGYMYEVEIHEIFCKRSFL